MNSRHLTSITGLLCMTALTLAHAQGPAVPPALKLNVNDISFLWPVPTSATEAGKLISLKSKAADGGDLMSDEVFSQLLKLAGETQVEGSRISIPAQLVSDKAAWKVAAIRVNPSSLGSNKLILEAEGAGEVPSLRLIVQPVTVNGTKARVHDIAVHVVFLFVKGRDEKQRFIPDREAFGRIVAHLRGLKAELAQQHNITTKDMEMDMHPGFANNDAAGLTEKISALLQQHLRKEHLMALSFMGIPAPAPEPWIFFAAGVETGADGSQALKPKPVNGHFTPPGPPAQMLAFIGDRRVVPEPMPDANAVKKGFGICTALLFGEGENKLEDKIFPDLTTPKFPFLAAKRRDIPDLVANPNFFHTGNMDCASCHSETTRRQDLLKDEPPSPFAFKPTVGIPKARHPSDKWNVRVFGWGKPRSGPFEATITQRAVNEAADSADFISKTYPN